MKRKILKISFLLLILLIGFICVANYLIVKNAENKTSFEIGDLKKNKVGLLLGTSKHLKSGYINPYYTYRLEAAVELYKSGKIDFILVSGDNGSQGYDEPTAFREDLIKNGIPENKIVLDYAGFRTLDSVIRAKEIFGQTKITIISQKFHNERAIYLAEKNGIQAVGYNAKNVAKRFGIKVQLREYLARTKVFLDIVFNVKPKYLGEKVVIK